MIVIGYILGVLAALMVTEVATTALMMSVLLAAGALFILGIDSHTRGDKNE